MSSDIGDEKNSSWFFDLSGPENYLSKIRPWQSKLEVGMLMHLSD
jgi:hypothetical protein